MNAFAAASRVEEEGLRALLPFLVSAFPQTRFVPISPDTELGLLLQQEAGDLLLIKEGSPLRFAEVKVDETPHENFFLEVWSNFPHRPGWMETSRSDFLLYFFVTRRKLYIIKMKELRRWFFGKEGHRPYPMKSQHRFNQRNEARGVCVPISVVKQNVGFAEYDVERGLK